MNSTETDAWNARNVMKLRMMEAFRTHASFIQKMGEREQKRDGTVTEATLNEIETLKEVDEVLSRVKV